MNAVLPPEVEASLPSRWHSVLVFAASSIAWIVSTDVLAGLIPMGAGPNSLFSTAKGLLYVLVASGWLAFLLGRRAEFVQRTVAELAMCAARQRQTLDLLPEAILLTTDMTITYANPAACRLFRTRRASDLEGRSTLDIVVPEQHVLVRVRIAARAAGETPPEHTFTMVRMDGSLMQVLTTATPLPGCEGQMAQIVLRDQSHAANLTKRLREAEAKYHAVLDLSRTAIVIAAADTGIVDEANAQAGVLFRRPPADLIGLHFTELAVAGEREHCLAVLRDSESMPQLLNLQHADGTEVIVHMQAMPIDARAGRSARSILIEMWMPDVGSAVIAHTDAGVRSGRSAPLLVTKRLTKLA